MIFSTKRGRNLTEYEVNSNFNDEIVSIAINHNESPVCTEFEVFIFAIGIQFDASMVQTINNVGQIIPSTASKNNIIIILW